MYIQLLLVALLSVSSWSKKPSDPVYGEGTFEQSPVALSQVMTNFKQQYDGKQVVVRGQVEKVCEKMGCWLILKDGKTQVRAIMKDHGFSVPKEIKGKSVLVSGQLIEKEMPKPAIKHYLKEEGLNDKQIEAELKKIPGKTKKMFQFVAEAVKAA